MSKHGWWDMQNTFETNLWHLKKDRLTPLTRGSSMTASSGIEFVCRMDSIRVGTYLEA